ncbi:VgrG-related protein [Gloeothece verrucosa]|uniref:Rhs element Vgr protein n=1 Tax=Gloeothece verrucosa (strain PCC 7822) TaxID=497965 RepID=E0UAR3_GLOV7|nr:VgrG-related protein [Gloeothece verrucosa]ADN13915.1 Rhs element Vgr protein [Gloeothece verrucosa PCC 7822]
MGGEQYKVPEVEIEIDNQKMDGKFIEDILHLSVEESLHMPSLCTLVINNDYYPGRDDKEKPWKHNKLLQIGKSIKIKFKASTTEQFKEKDQQPSPMFEGDITGIDCHFTDESQAPIVVRAYDASHRLHRGRYNRSYQNMTDSDIVKKIASEVSIKPGEIENSGAPHDYLFQQNQTNMEFLRDRAFRLGYELYIQDNKLNFHKPKEKGNLELKWLKHINSFRVRVSSAEQVNKVEVRGWDYKEKKAIVSTAETDQVITENTNGKGKSVSSKFKTTPKMIVVDKPIFNSKEADKIAQALCNELGGEYVIADARGEGNPQIRVGKVVKLQEMGPYDGKYYITETRHIYHKRVYSTDFTVRGLRGGNLLTTLSPSTYLKPGQTLLVGIVTDNKDPDGLGRVKVKMPTLTEDHTSYWARVVAIGAGIQRGFDCLPEVNDEVLIGFEHGDIHRPYVFGGVWNGKDKPPEPVEDSVVGAKVRLRTFKTRIGHKLQFVEEDKGASKSGVYIETAKKHQIRINDSDRHIEIKTTNGHQIKMDDAGQKIDIKTTSGHQITMNDGGASITVQSIGNLTIQAQGNINISANGTISIQGAMIRLN